ncbi:MAG: hypothetical protein R3Y43_02135 [Alphaproteobacteria bacterium]
MLIRAKLINEETKEYQILNQIVAEKQGIDYVEVEQGYDGKFYLSGYAPIAPEPTYAEKRVLEYPTLNEQLDMMYWDKVNETNLWQEKITEIKEKYPK